MPVLPDLARSIVLCCTLIQFGYLYVTPQSGDNNQTFSFRKFEATVISPYQMIHVSQENAQFVRSHVLTELEAHGLSHSDSADLYVDLFVHLKLERQATGGLISTNSGGYNMQGISIYEVGTLTVKLHDATNDKLLWEGSRTIPLWKKKEKRIRKQVDNLVDKIFKNFDLELLE